MASHNVCIKTVEGEDGVDEETGDSSVLDERFYRKIVPTIPEKRQDVLSWCGWGYKDAGFYSKNGIICFKGDQYPIGDCELPALTDFMYRTLDIVPSESYVVPPLPTKYPMPVLNADFLRQLEETGVAHSLDGADRLIRCHCQTLHDICHLRENAYERIPDVVIFPRSHDDVEIVVGLANNHDVVVIPYGGGTSVSGASLCPQKEPRMICVLDTTQMNRLVWLNRQNLTACFEAGILGQDLERELQKLGLTVGHEPDSYEFSTLGGWVATRASGMKKNVYGNIDDLMVRVRMVTPTGVLERECSAPRISCGPDFNQLILGSEGTLGVITEVVLKVRPLPPVKRYGSLVFPNFECGVQFMREVARRRCQPASVRLMDNTQFVLGQCLLPKKSWFGHVVDSFKKFYVSNVKGLDFGKICAVTLLFEGEKTDVQRQETLIYSIAKQFQGFAAGGQNGERGYVLTFVIAYIRDYVLSQGIIGESFETSVPWDRCATLCHNVKRRVELEAQRQQIKRIIICYRVTQTYDAGACVYFYLTFTTAGLNDPLATFEHIETAARETILTSGGSLSHHHGVGKIRSRWYQQTVSSMGIELYKAAKNRLDPKNIFAVGNLLTPEDWKQLDDEKLSSIVKSKL